MKNNDVLSFLKNISLVLCIGFMGSGPAIAQDYIFNLETINIETGLPHRMTHGLAQDKEGFIWVSTPGTISRYDGYTFKTYNSAFLGVGDYNPIRMAIDARNRLWYCNERDGSSMSGVIDTDKDTIYLMETISGGLFTSKDVVYLRNAAPGSDDILLITRNGTVYKYDGGFRKIYQYPHLSNIPPVCRENPDGSYWIVYGSVAFKVKNGKTLETVKITETPVREIAATTPKLLLEMQNSPVNYRILENGRLTPFSVAPHTPEVIKKICLLNKDYTCYIAGDSLFIRDTHGKLLFGAGGIEFPDTQQTGSSGYVLLDKQNILWIPTLNGLLKLTAKKNPFEVLLPGTSIRGIYKEKDTLWVGTLGHYGTSVAGSKSPGSLRRKIPLHNAISFYKDLEGRLLTGRFNKIVEYNRPKNTFDEHTVTNSKFFQVFFHNPVTHHHWAGTDNRLFRFDPKTWELLPFPLPVTSREVTIQQFYQNKQGIWIVTNEGLFLLDSEKETLLHHYTKADGLPTNSINYLYEDATGIFWLGTKDDGLVRWDRQNNTFRQFTRDDELSNDNIYAVYEDDYETLWLPSDYGLMAFDKNTAITRVYLPKDGIAHEEFNRFSHFRDTDGTLYFGGLSGITRFHPEALRKNAGTTFPLYISRVRVLPNKAETFINKTEAFKASQSIKLSPNDRILELDLTLLDYERSSENQYAYRLSGKQDQWIYTRTNRLTIINPPYGKYDLVIKARGASGVWSENLLVIPMEAQAPFYKQWWFAIVLILIIITGIFIGLRWRVRKLRKDRERLEKEVQNRTQKIAEQAEELKALDKAKTRFFANITHEFRTPLTLVTGPLEQILEEPAQPAALKRKLSGVLKNTRNLMELINQLLDLSKLESGRMKVDIHYGDIIRYTRELVQQFQPLADKKQLYLEFHSNIKEWKIHIDIDKWTKIVYNLLSNAIKFTSEGDSISIGLEHYKWENREYLRLMVKDTGIGISLENLEHIFDRFYQADASSTRLQGGTGIGLSLVREFTTLLEGTITAKSIIHEGSEFVITLPVTTVANGANYETADIFSPPLSVFPLFTGETEPAGTPVILNGKAQLENREKLELLIIEDNDEMRHYIRSCIDTSLYTIFEASDGEEGVEKALELVPDLIISDVMMPKKNGFEVTEAIRAHLATSHIPLILLTARASLESRLKGLERGADVYLTKPFSPQELTLRIKKLIELRKLMQQRYQSRQTPPEENLEFKKEDRFIGELKGYILENLSEPSLDVDTISRRFAMSRVQLYRKLHALIDMPVAHYIKSIRLEEAMRLLQQRELNVSEIAYETGFSPSNFSKIFKKAYGKAPSEFYS